MLNQTSDVVGPKYESWSSHLAAVLFLFHVKDIRTKHGSNFFARFFLNPCFYPRSVMKR